MVEQTFSVNYYGTLEATRRFLPIIKDNGRLVNVASQTGNLSHFSAEIQQRFRSAKTMQDVDALAQDFSDAVAAGKEKKLGWVSAAYSTSKALAIAMTNVIAEEEKKKGTKVLINSCCPG